MAFLGQPPVDLSLPVFSLLPLFSSTWPAVREGPHTGDRSSVAHLQPHIPPQTFTAIHGSEICVKAKAMLCVWLYYLGVGEHIQNWLEMYLLL